MSEVVYGGIPAAEVEKLLEKEYEMALQDRVMEETKEKKNAVEAYVYDMRNKVEFYLYFTAWLFGSLHLVMLQCLCIFS